MKILSAFLALCTGAFFAEISRQRRPDLPSGSPPSTFVEAAPRQEPVRPPRDSDALADLTPIRPPVPRETPAMSPARSAEPRVGGTKSVGKGESAPLIPVSKPVESDAAKFFRVSIVIQSKEGMVATGRFYDPEYVAQPGEIQRLPKYQSPLDQSAAAAHGDWQPTRDIIIRGLTSVIEGDEWSGMLVRDGVASYYHPNIGNRTVAAYCISDAPLPYFPPKNPRAWMWK